MAVNRKNKINLCAPPIVVEQKKRPLFRSERRKSAEKKQEQQFRIVDERFACHQRAATDSADRDRVRKKEK